MLIQAILGIYADYLADKNQHADAALGMSLLYLIVAYELVGEKEMAVDSYTKAGLWRESLNIAYSIPMPTTEITQLADRLAESLVSRREFADAATVYIEYGKDDAAISKAVNALANGYQFTEAIRIVNLLGVVNDRSMNTAVSKKSLRLFIPPSSIALDKPWSLSQS